MKLNFVFSALISAGLFVLPACKKRKGPPVQNPTDYTAEMAGMHQWRLKTWRTQVDSTGDTTFVPYFHIGSDPIIVFTNTKIALESSKSWNRKPGYDTFYFAGSDVNENTIAFTKSTSTQYYSSRSELKYNYIQDTFVLRSVRWDAFPPPGVDSVVYYSYSP